jgi:hypothetical protein
MPRRTLVALTPAQRRLRAQVAVNADLARTENPVARTAAARKAFMDRFERQARELHPDGSPEVIARAAEHLRKAHMARLALASSKARSRKAGGAGG